MGEILLNVLLGVVEAVTDKHTISLVVENLYIFRGEKSSVVVVSSGLYGCGLIFVAFRVFRGGNRASALQRKPFAVLASKNDCCQLRLFLSQVSHPLA